jgi:hypothetical protein
MQIATDLYSASALDLETVGCRLDDQDTKFCPRKTQKSDVDLRVSGQPAQSASLHAMRSVEEDQKNCNP